MNIQIDKKSKSSKWEYMGIQVDKAHQMNVIAAYASIFVRNDACPKNRDYFYERLEKALRTHEKKQARTNVN